MTTLQKAEPETQPEPDFDVYLNLFEKYLKSNSGGKKDPKNAGNEKAQMRRMMSVICKGNIPHYLSFVNLKLVEDVWIKGHCLEKKYEPGTIKSYLLSLGQFYDFLMRSNVCPSLPNTVPVNHLSTDQLKVAQNEVSKWRSSLRVEEDHRQYQVMVEDGDNILTREDFSSVLESSSYKQIITKLTAINKKHSENTDKPEKSELFLLNLETFVNIRDCLLFNLIVCNISRSGAVANMTLEEYHRARASPTGHYVVQVMKHKTARKYGPCQIIIREEMKQHFDTYVNMVRPQVPGKKCEHFFTSWTGVKMEPGGVSTQISTFFEKCLGVDFCKERRISATLIRKSLLTYIYDKLPEMKEELGNLMKHDPKTGERFYHLSILRKECAATLEKVHNAIFGELPGNVVDDGDYVNGSHSDTDSSYDDDLPDLKKPRKTWTKEEESLLIELFGDTDMESCHLPLIRQVLIYF